MDNSCNIFRNLAFEHGYTIEMRDTPALCTLIMEQYYASMTGQPEVFRKLVSVHPYKVGCMVV